MKAGLKFSAAGRFKKSLKSFDDRNERKIEQ
jgi:hypothetical protein